MHVVACAFTAMMLGAAMAGPAAAQNYGGGSYNGDGYRSGPPQRYDGPSRYDDRRDDGPSRYEADRPRYEERPRYEAERLRYEDRPRDERRYDDRPPDRRPNFDRPPMRGGPPSSWRQSAPPRQAWPDPRERNVSLSSRPIPPNASQGYRRFWSEDGGSRGKTTMGPPPGRRDAPPPSRVTERRPAAAERMSISVTEFRELQDRVRELERMLHNTRRDFHDDRGPQQGPRVYYR